MSPVIGVISLVVGFMAMLLLLTGVKIIQPWEQGLWIVLGRYKRRLNPGFNFVTPMVSTVVPIDLRTEVLDVPRQEVITKDNSPTNVDALIYIKVVNPEKCYFEVANYRQATIGLAQTTLRSVIGDMELDEILYNRDSINTKLRDILDDATDSWGVKVEAVEIREVDPVGRVKAAMEEQTSAERMRRAAILKAEGARASAILEAEGRKQARILEAEGLRTARVLEAEGQREARILEAQGESQQLRILSLGAAALDQKGMTVLALEALRKLGDSPSTKIVVPFEITSLLAGAAAFLGASRQIPDRQANDLSKLETLIGRDLLGPMPNHGEIRRQLEQVQNELQQTRTTAEMVTGPEAPRSLSPPQPLIPPPPRSPAGPPPQPLRPPQAPAAGPPQMPRPSSAPDKTEVWEWPKVLDNINKKDAPAAPAKGMEGPENMNFDPEFEYEERPEMTEPRWELNDPRSQKP